MQIKIKTVQLALLIYQDLRIQDLRVANIAPHQQTRATMIVTQLRLESRRSLLNGAYLLRKVIQTLVQWEIMVLATKVVMRLGRRTIIIIL